MNTKSLCSVFFCLAMLPTMPVMAQQQGGVVVQGDVDINAEAGDITNLVDGDNAIGEVNIGTVGGANTAVGGDVSIDATTGDVTNAVSGDGAKGCVNVGSVGTSACQN